MSKSNCNTDEKDMESLWVVDRVNTQQINQRLSSRYRVLYTVDLGKIVTRNYSLKIIWSNCTKLENIKIIRDEGQNFEK